MSEKKLSQASPRERERERDNLALKSQQGPSSGAPEPWLRGAAFDKAPITVLVSFSPSLSLSLTFTHFLCVCVRLTHTDGGDKVFLFTWTEPASVAMLPRRR